MSGRRVLAQSAVALLLSALLVGPFFLARGGTAVPATHDMAQHVSVLLQFDQAVRDGSLYPRWQSEFNRGYGLPWLNYYPPGFYFLSEIFFGLTRHWTIALLIVCVGLTAGSGLAFYALARTFFSTRASVLGALFYLLAPYRIVDLYWRGALPELSGFFFVPAVLLFAYRAGTSGNRRDIAALGLLHGCYLFFHFPVAYLFTITLALYAVSWSLLTQNVRVAWRIGCGVALALVVSAAYWLPAFLERTYVREPFSDQFPYHLSYVTLMPGGDIFTHLVNRTFVALALALVVLLPLLRNTQSVQTRLFIWMAVATLFMITPYSVFISKLIPGIQAISFAWRWLLIVSCAVALVVAAAADHKQNMIVLVIIVVAVHGWIAIRAVTPVFRNANLEAPVQRDEFGFLPGGASNPDALPDTDPVVVTSGTVTIKRWKPLHRIVTVSGATRVRLKTFSFAGWTARVDGKPARIESDSDGAQIIRVSSATHEIETRFENTRVQKWALALSLLGLLGVTSALYPFATRRRNTPLRTTRDSASEA